MKRAALGMLGLAVAFLSGCFTPSVHPIYAETDSALAEPGLVGTWKQDTDRVTYTITRLGEGYHLLVKDNDPDAPRQWEFAVRLVQIGSYRFGDVTAVEEERRAHEDHWGALFVPTHLFARYTLDGDTLRVNMLSHRWFMRAAADKVVDLPHTPLGKDTVLITAETPRLKAFLERWAGDAAAFSDETVLQRVRP